MKDNHSCYTRICKSIKKKERKEERKKRNKLGVSVS